MAVGSMVAEQRPILVSKINSGTTRRVLPTAVGRNRQRCRSLAGAMDAGVMTV